ncbi:hypothetical protein ZYGR_0S02050 [Zygosaccharomyces rouxii]|uniref:ZYRO0F07084p n=2 Tax=Zygosaccharomyces rouxii TaxID=4956 RepID=C5DXR1_ZYGRC|nr:uncharacterized protein ZYRO0F07084g [Zygosaccharomyces rouxii]GAV50071.1 hypothetical protein ZYGR_0S02050 [Zygosaccharomyces rouxii]CAR28572.1 ZYRO0F07084p [Zygosaccharomyces rouxii]
MIQRVLGIGTDIVFTPRISHLLQRFPPNGSGFKRLTTKFMHQHELEELQLLLYQKKDPTTYLAGVWATKECVWKAMTSFVDPKLMPPAISVYTRLCYKTKGPRGSPFLVFDSNFPQTTPLHSLFYNEVIYKRKIKALLSISHDKDYLVAFMTMLEDIN